MNRESSCPFSLILLTNLDNNLEWRVTFGESHLDITRFGCCQQSLEYIKCISCRGVRSDQKEVLPGGCLQTQPIFMHGLNFEHDQCLLIG